MVRLFTASVWNWRADSPWIVGVNLATTFEHEPATATHATSPPSLLHPPDTVASWEGSV